MGSPKSVYSRLRDSFDSQAEDQVLLQPDIIPSNPWTIKLTDFLRASTLVLHPIVVASLLCRGTQVNRIIVTVVFLCMSLGYNLFLILHKIISRYVTISIEFAFETSEVRTRIRKSRAGLGMKIDLLLAILIFGGMIIAVVKRPYYRPESILADTLGFAICVMHIYFAAAAQFQKDVLLSASCIDSRIKLPQYNITESHQETEERQDSSKGDNTQETGTVEV